MPSKRCRYAQTCFALNKIVKQSWSCSGDWRWRPSRRREYKEAEGDFGPAAFLSKDTKRVGRLRDFRYNIQSLLCLSKEHWTECLFHDCSEDKGDSPGGIDSDDSSSSPVPPSGVQRTTISGTHYQTAAGLLKGNSIEVPLNRHRGWELVTSICIIQFSTLVSWLVIPAGAIQLATSAGGSQAVGSDGQTISALTMTNTPGGGAVVQYAAQGQDGQFFVPGGTRVCFHPFGSSSNISFRFVCVCVCSVFNWWPSGLRHTPCYDDSRFERRCRRRHGNSSELTGTFFILLINCKLKFYFWCFVSVLEFTTLVRREGAETGNSNHEGKVSIFNEYFPYN